jgi:hypothetical protein
LPGIWTANHRGDGVVLLAQTCRPVKSQDFLTVYPSGAPTPSIAARWQRCPDPHAPDPTDPAGWTWTENNIRQLMHYMLVREGVNYATKIAPTLDYWKAASDVCDQAIPLKEGGTEPRWRSCVAHKHTDPHASVKASLLLACDGWIAPRADGALVVYAGQFYEPIVEIGPDEIVAYEWQGVGVDDDQAVNELVCSYVSSAHDYSTVECDAWRDEDDISARGQVLSENLEMQVPSWGQARRLAKRRMARQNALHRGTIVTNIAGRKVRGHRYIRLRLAEAGAEFFNGPVEITAVTRNVATGGMTFSWIAADPNVDAWNPATEEGEPAALGDRVAQEPLAAPIINSAEPQFEADDTAVRALLDITGPDRDDLTWFARWRVDGDVSWNESSYADLDPGTPVSVLTGMLPLNGEVEIQAAYGAGDGRKSPWSATVDVDTTP